MRQVVSLVIRDSGSDGGGTYNDDCWGSVSTAVWILDGATDLTNERLFPTAPSDAQWFVSAVDLELRNADWSQATIPLLQSVMQRVLRRCQLEAGGRSDRVSLGPSASFALVRAWGDHIEFVNLGDCRMLWQRSNGDAVHAFGSSPITELDAKVVKEIKRLHREGHTSNEVVRKAITPLLEAHRELKNSPKGYWILDLGGKGIPHAQTLVVDVANVETILLCTDGYYRLVDTYRRGTDQSLLSGSLASGVSAMIQEIRNIERMDEHCLEFPRIKPSDDATAVLASANCES